MFQIGLKEMKDVNKKKFKHKMNDLQKHDNSQFDFYNQN